MWRAYSIPSFSEVPKQAVFVLFDTALGELCELTKKNATLVWKPDYQFPILNYHDPCKSHSLQTDASMKGPGAVLLKEGHQIHSGNKSLQPWQIA